MISGSGSPCSSVPTTTTKARNCRNSRSGVSAGQQEHGGQRHDAADAGAETTVALRQLQRALAEARGPEPVEQLVTEHPGEPRDDQRRQDREQIPIVGQSPGPGCTAPSRMPARFSPMNRKTAFSSRNWTVAS